MPHIHVFYTMYMTAFFFYIVLQLCVISIPVLIL